MRAQPGRLSAPVSSKTSVLKGMSTMSKSLRAFTALAILILAAGCASQSPTGPAPTGTSNGVYANGEGP